MSAIGWSSVAPNASLRARFDSLCIRREPPAGDPVRAVSVVPVHSLCLEADAAPSAPLGRAYAARRSGRTAFENPVGSRSVASLFFGTSA